MFQNPFSFKGRIRRLEFALSFIFVYIGAILVGLIIGFAGIPIAIMYFLLIPFCWFIFAQGAKRCHDRGNTGWYQIIPYYYLWLLFGDGQYGENEYGPNPKGLGNVNVEEMIDDIGNSYKEEN